MHAHFTGTGTRQLQEPAKKAIEDLFTRSFRVTERYNFDDATSAAPRRHENCLCNRDMTKPDCTSTLSRCVLIAACSSSAQQAGQADPQQTPKAQQCQPGCGSCRRFQEARRRVRQIAREGCGGHSCRPPRKVEARRNQRGGKERWPKGTRGTACRKARRHLYARDAGQFSTAAQTAADQGARRCRQQGDHQR